MIQPMESFTSQYSVGSEVEDVDRSALDCSIDASGMASMQSVDVEIRLRADVPSPSTRSVIRDRATGSRRSRTRVRANTVSPRIETKPEDVSLENRSLRSRPGSGLRRPACDAPYRDVWIGNGASSGVGKTLGSP